MLKQFLSLWRRDSLCQESFDACLEMLRQCEAMFLDAVASLHREGVLKTDIYDRDRAINKFERRVRRNIVSHLAVSNNPDINTALVLTAIVIDIERIGDYTKNILELASAHPQAFRMGDIESEIAAAESTVREMFAALPGCISTSDSDVARRILGDHQSIVDRVDECLHELITGRALKDDSGAAVTAALYLRYLKRVSAHLKNVASSVVNPYYRIGFREKLDRSADSDPDD